MPNCEGFDLPEFMLSHFDRVDFGGDLFGQWPVGLRFQIGVGQVARATTLYEFVFANAGECILISQDWATDGDLAKRYTTLFTTPGVFPSNPTKLQSVEVSPFDETPYRLTWARLSPIAFNAPQMFQAIANRDQDGIPKISSGVFVIEPHSKAIMHMYDDRGLDVIAVKLNTLRPVFENFGDWILENQRHRITSRFKSTPDESSG
jgi:hypothetical protein